MRLPSFPAARDDARTGGHAHAGPHRDFPFGAEQDVDARAELDEAHSFAGGNAVAGLLVEDDAARDQSGDLFENHAGACALDGDDVLLVLGGTRLAAGDVKPPLVVLDGGDVAADRSAVDVNVENV